MPPIDARLLVNAELYREVVLDKLCRARESVWISTANVKEMFVERPTPRAGARKDDDYVSILDVFAGLARRGVELRLLHADLPSRPFRAAFDRKRSLVAGGLQLKICPRVHFKCVLVDGGWLYLGSANLTGAGLGAKADTRRNFEVGFATEDFDTIDRITALFEAVWSGAECRTCRVREHCPDPIGPAGKPPRRSRAPTSLVTPGRARRITPAARER